MQDAPSTQAFLLALLTAGGGITGYIRTGSVPSIAAGVTVGALVRVPQHQLPSPSPLLSIISREKIPKLTQILFTNEIVRSRRLQDAEPTDVWGGDGAVGQSGAGGEFDTEGDQVAEAVADRAVVGCGVWVVSVRDGVECAGSLILERL
jgi:hypothetical protein